MSVGVCRIDVLLHAGRLLQARSVRALHRDQAPCAVLLLPGLVVGERNRLPVRQTRNHFGAKDETDMSMARFIADDLHRDASWHQPKPKAGLDLDISGYPVNADLHRGVSAVENFQCAGVAREHGPLPLLKWGESRRGIRDLSEAY